MFVLYPAASTRWLIKKGQGEWVLQRRGRGRLEGRRLLGEHLMLPLGHWTLSTSRSQKQRTYCLRCSQAGCKEEAKLWGGVVALAWEQFLLTFAFVFLIIVVLSSRPFSSLSGLNQDDG